MDTKESLYTIEDVGCYVDSARGIYATDVIVDFANNHGATIEHDPECCERMNTSIDSEFAGCENSGDYEDDADDYMNTNFPVDGAYWGRNNYGDWGLWATEEE